MIAAIRLQPAGTWLPLRVKRGDDTLELVVKFPAEAMSGRARPRERSRSSRRSSPSSLRARSGPPQPSLELDVELDPGTRRFQRGGPGRARGARFPVRAARIAAGERRVGRRQAAARRCGGTRRADARLAGADAGGRGQPAPGIWRNAAGAGPQSRRIAACCGVSRRWRRARAASCPRRAPGIRSRRRCSPIGSRCRCRATSARWCRAAFESESLPSGGVGPLPGQLRVRAPRHRHRPDGRAVGRSREDHAARERRAGAAAHLFSPRAGCHRRARARLSRRGARLYRALRVRGSATIRSPSSASCRARRRPGSACRRSPISASRCCGCRSSARPRSATRCCTTGGGTASTRPRARQLVRGPHHVHGGLRVQERESSDAARDTRLAWLRDFRRAPRRRTRRLPHSHRAPMAHRRSSVTTRQRWCS